MYYFSILYSFYPFILSTSNGANVRENDLRGQPCAATKCPLAAYMHQQETSACKLFVTKAPAESELRCAD